MHGTVNLKFIEAKQAKEVYQYKNIKHKLHKTTAAIWYNKLCRQKHLTPTYTNLQINGNNRQCQRTLKMATQYRINQEIKFLYIKKTKLNEQLYKLHLECANKWHNTWQIIQDNMDQYLTNEMEKHYDNLNKKLDKLINQQHHKNRMNTNAQGHHFYPRTVNHTNIIFTQEETALLNKGLQHSIQKPIDRYWTDLIIETERAIRTLDTNIQNTMRILATTKLKENGHQVVIKISWQDDKHT
jgi:hypothetical protein